MARTPTSATGAAEPPAQRAAAGFTLIEVLVVMVIFAIAAGLIALRLLPDDLERARHEAEATALLIERAADEAERTGRPLDSASISVASRTCVVNPCAQSLKSFSSTDTYVRNFIIPL